jgi:hypothetical protein
MQSQWGPALSGSLDLWEQALAAHPRRSREVVESETNLQIAFREPMAVHVR